MQRLAVLLAATVVLAPLAGAQKLSERYPGGLDWRRDAEGLSWVATPEDVLRLREFRLRQGDDLALDAPSGGEVVFGHHRGNVLWAVVLLDEPAALSVPGLPGDGELAHTLWLRFHPSWTERLFRERRVAGPGDPLLLASARRVHDHKLRSMWFTNSGRPVVVPEGALIVDADTVEGTRRAYLAWSQSGEVSHLSDFAEPLAPSAPVDAEVARAALEEVWTAFDLEYAQFVQLPDLDWGRARERAQARLEDVRTLADLAGLLARMLGELEDQHAWLRFEGTFLPTHEPPRPENSSARNLRARMGDLAFLEPNVSWARVGDVGYVVVWGLGGEGLPAAFDRALAALADTRGLVLDLRFNGGGDERLGWSIAGRFLAEPVVYSSSRWRSGPRHGDLGPPRPRTCAPREDLPRREGPVAVLQGPRTMSSAESLVHMLRAAPDVRTYGAPTAGSSGNPRPLELSVGITVHLPRWLDLGPDGEPLPRSGIEPDVEVECSLADLEAGRDPVLERALLDLTRR